jgi:hypothetical protein
MRMLRWTLLAAAILAVTPATAQRYDPYYPICFEGKIGDSYRIDCSYTSLDQCRATASGLGATCRINPYWSQANRIPPGRSSRHQGQRY